MTNQSADVVEETFKTAEECDDVTSQHVGHPYPQKEQLCVVAMTVVDKYPKSLKDTLNSEVLRKNTESLSILVATIM